MNTIVRFVLERIFVVFFGLTVIIIGVVSPKYVMVNLLTVFQRVNYDIYKCPEK